MSKLLKLVQIGKRELQMDDEAYRSLLEEVTGQRSSRGLPDFKLSMVIDRMKSLGFVPRQQGQSQTNPRRYRSSEAPKILAIWITMFKQGFVRNGSDQALDAYVKRMTSITNGGKGIERAAWLKSEEAYVVLESLKRWHYRLMSEAIVAAGGRIPSNDNCTGPAGYDKLAGFYREMFNNEK
ncbi:gp16 family protein [Vibrio cholerae]|uniref:gp16 family protein n=1 Tax=Vibrio cholerae TaxID=666 RepID=UPI00155F0399|nr:regulatory protein GemA [Vibrio cholerae]NOE32008.1 DUF1018 domain-containing protein [Vibrio cholerae]